MLERRVSAIDCTVEFASLRMSVIRVRDPCPCTGYSGARAYISVHVVHACSASWYMVSMHEEGAWPEKARYLQLQRMSMCLLVLVCKNDITMDCWKTQYMTERGTQASASRVFISSQDKACLLYTSPSPRDATLSRMPSSA